MQKKQISSIIFFLIFVKNLEIPKYDVEDDLDLNMNSHLTLKAVFKYKNHPSIISIRRFCHQVSSFNFSCINKNTVLKKTIGLSTTKASQDNANYFPEFLCIHFNLETIKQTAHSSASYL